MEVLRRLAALRFVALILAALMAAGALHTTAARLIAGDPDHMCHCNTRGGHAECACPVCFPELRDDGLFDGPVASSRCGDDDAGWQTRALLGVLSAPVVLRAPPPELVLSWAIDAAPADIARGPDPPPPKSFRS